jgi:hypothetical protein
MSINGITEKIGVGLTMSRRLTDPPIQIMVFLAGGLVALGVGEYYIATRLGMAYTVLPFVVLYFYYQFIWLSTPKAETEKYLTFKVGARVARPDAGSAAAASAHGAFLSSALRLRFSGVQRSHPRRCDGARSAGRTPR